MATTEVEFFFEQRNLSREKVRRVVVEKFLEEHPGPAGDETYNRYHYRVEHTPEGDVILIRPANLKLGFDFRIDVEGMTFGKGRKLPTSAPTHIDIFEDLKMKRLKNRKFCDEVIAAIIDVINMKDPKNVLEKIKDKNIGFSVEMILKVSKWFAIEQDIRYWNGWGRNKQTAWLRMMQHFDFNYMPTKSGFKFRDAEGILITENKAQKIIDEK